MQASTTTATGASSTVRVGFHGIRGAFAEEAIKRLHHLHTTGPLFSTPLFSSRSVSLSTAPFERLDTLISALLDSRTIDHVILPLENIRSGMINSTIDLLVHHQRDPNPEQRLFITGEFVYDERYCLVANPEADSLDNITEIWSHPDVLAQCHDFISNLPQNKRGENGGVVYVHRQNSAACARDLASVAHASRLEYAKNAKLYSMLNRTSRSIPTWSRAKGDDLLAMPQRCAAIAGKNAAAIYGLKVLCEDITATQSGSGSGTPAVSSAAVNRLSNLTRYVIVSRQPVIPERHLIPKTSIALSVPNATGILFKILGSFAMRDINVCRLETRQPRAPSANTGDDDGEAGEAGGDGLARWEPKHRAAVHGSWEYTILLDIDGAAAPSSAGGDDNVLRAVENLREFSKQVIVLGQYPRYTSVYPAASRQF
ncbi:hypothetical protein GQ42DRAFT_160158 [Ramicandelaber brevisporus]|nr:hypothetical protein GQ42DRAFT_160158 [Ramicandelaber brevisporus]